MHSKMYKRNTYYLNINIRQREPHQIDHYSQRWCSWWSKYLQTTFSALWWELEMQYWTNVGSSLVGHELSDVVPTSADQWENCQCYYNMVLPTLVQHALSDIVPTLADHWEYFKRWSNIDLPTLYQRWHFNVGTTLEYCLRRCRPLPTLAQRILASWDFRQF